MSSSPPAQDPHTRQRRRQTNESIKSQGSRLRRRLGTWTSTRSAGSQTSQRSNSASTTGIVQNVYPCYGLDWETLKEYLLEVWPEENFEEPLSTVREKPVCTFFTPAELKPAFQDNDRFVFETPSPGLTEVSSISKSRLMVNEAKH